jgi:hypothetical protein
MALFGHVFGYLPLRDTLGRVSFVCRHWLTLVQSPTIWRVMRQRPLIINDAIAIYTLPRVFPEACGALRHLTLSMTSMKLTGLHELLDRCTQLTTLHITCGRHHGTSTPACPNISHIKTLINYTQYGGDVPLSFPSGLKELRLEDDIGITGAWTAPKGLDKLHIQLNPKIMVFDLSQVAPSLSDLHLHGLRNRSFQLCPSFVAPGKGNLKNLSRLSFCYSLSHSKDLIAAYASSIVADTITYIKIPVDSGWLHHKSLRGQKWSSLRVLELVYPDDSLTTTRADALLEWGHAMKTALHLSQLGVVTTPQIHAFGSIVDAISEWPRLPPLCILREGSSKLSQYVHVPEDVSTQSRNLVQAVFAVQIPSQRSLYSTDIIFHHERDTNIIHQPLDRWPQMSFLRTPVYLRNPNIAKIVNEGGSIVRITRWHSMADEPFIKRLTNQIHFRYCDATTAHDLMKARSSSRSGDASNGICPYTIISTRSNDKDNTNSEAKRSDKQKIPTPQLLKVIVVLIHSLHYYHSLRFSLPFLQT